MLFPDFHDGSFGLSCLGDYNRKQSEGGIKMSGFCGHDRVGIAKKQKELKGNKILLAWH